MMTREQVLDLFQPILARIDLGILFADTAGRLLRINPAARQILRLDLDDEPASLSDLGGFDLLGRIERAADPDHVLADPVCSDAVEIEIELGAPLDEPVFVQVRTGFADLPCEDGRLRILMLRDVTHFKALAAAVAKREEGGMHSRDPQMLELLARIGVVSPTEAPVLLQGESGTGKTVLARSIHHQSRRAAGPFVEVNCAAIPASLIESELFGHVKGAFTGAARARMGRFRLANGGTLFLDEVNELPMELQTKLLRVLEGGRFEAVGSDRTTAVDVRLITASNQPLRQLVDNGLFRADLYYRIAVIPLQIPPLRERPSDIKQLADHFLELFAGRSEVRSLCFSDATMHQLLDHIWPGNVRELRNAVEHGAICAHNGVIEPRDLPFDIRGSNRLPQPRMSGDDDSHRAQIEEAIAQAEGNRALAARLLGIDRSTLWRRMRRLGMLDE